ncbi:MAG: IclR family transcriptional regulator [Halarchaeum sp.]
MEKKANHPVRTTEKTLAIVERLRGVDGARIRDLEADLDMTKGAIHNHLSTLREHGYVVKNGDEYALSFRFLTVGGQIRRNHPLYRHGRAKVDQLAEDTDMLTNLVTEQDGRGVYLYQARGDYAVNLDTHVGYRIPLHNIAVGKAILASLPESRVDDIIERWGLPAATEKTITDPDELRAELADVREQGYATEHGERTEGLACIGAPVRLDDDLLGAISISAPTRRLGTDGFDEDIIGQVESTANELALEIKYQ